MKKKKLRNTRPKALFGESVAAAAISAAATMAAAGIGAAATARAAKEQSAATINNAKQQADAIEQTNINNNNLQQQSQQFIAQENEANRQIQRDLQMSLQLQGGQLDMEQRRAASRIQVKKGGRVRSRKKLRDAQFPLRGSYTDITTSDGGVNVPIGYSPEGYPMYRVTGDKHNEKHKVDGKLLGGVGENVPGVDNFEAEDGELLLDRRMSPHGDVAIASNLKHGNIYPARLIEAGYPVDPIIDEQEKVNRRIKSSPVKGNRHKALAGVSTNYILPTDYPINDLGFDMSGLNVGAARRQLKKGGRCKAANGNIVGGWITGGANVLSGIIGGLGSWYGNRYLAKGYPKAAEYLTNAYDNLRTIDMSGIRRDAFGNQHYMPVVRSTNYNVNPQLGDVDRSANAATKAINNNTLSSSARLSRMSGINQAVIDAKNKIYADKYNKEESIKQANNQALNEAAKQNVLMDVEANKDFMRTYVDVLKYNNDIVNEGITGKAQAMADAIMGAAQARAAGTQGLWSNIGSGLATGAAAIGTGYAAADKEKFELRKAQLVANFDDRVNDVIINGSAKDKQQLLQELNNRYNSSTDLEYRIKLRNYIDQLGGTYSLLNSKGLDVNTLQPQGLQDAIESYKNLRYYKL